MLANTSSLQEFVIHNLITSQFETIRRAAEQLMKAMYFDPSVVESGDVRDGMKDMSLEACINLLQKLHTAETSLRNNPRRMPGMQLYRDKPLLS